MKKNNQSQPKQSSSKDKFSALPPTDADPSGDGVQTGPDHGVATVVRTGEEGRLAASATGIVQAKGNIEVRDGGAMILAAGQDMKVTDGGGMILAAGRDVAVTNGGAGAILAGRDVILAGSSAPTMLAQRSARVSDQGALLLAAREAHLERSSLALVIAGKSSVAEDSRVLVNVSLDRIVGAIVGLTFFLPARLWARWRGKA